MEKGASCVSFAKSRTALDVSVWVIGTLLVCDNARDEKLYLTLTDCLSHQTDRKYPD